MRTTCREFEKDFPSLPPPPSTPPPAANAARYVFPDAERRQPPPPPGARQNILSASQHFTQIPVPALAIFASPHDVMTGDFEKFDEAMTERQARAFERGVPQARVLRWPHASHYLFLAQERDVLREINDLFSWPAATGLALTCMPNSGMIMPILGNVRSGRSRRKSLADALFTKTQQRVLGVLFGQPERSFYASEVIRDAGTGSGAAQRELAKLKESGLIVARRIGNQKHFQANPASPLFSELRNIVLKTVGLAEPLRDSLRPLSKAIRAAFVYGSVAKATDQSASDIDLMIISDSLTYGEVFGALEKVTRTVGRKVNPTVYTAAEFSKRTRTENAFVTRVLEQPKLWVIGSEDDLPVAA